MASLNKVITQLFKDNPYYILAFIDIETELNHEMVVKYFMSLQRNPAFNPYIDVDTIPMDKHVIIKYVDKDKFNDDISILDNKDVSNILCMVCCIDKINKSSRLYIRVNHAYADGYKIIEILSQCILKIDYNIPKFNRKTNILSTLYHYTFGTCILFMIYIKILIQCLCNIYVYKKSQPTNGITDYVICKPFKLNKIKKFAKKNNITVNDFLYSIMIKTDKLYNKTDRNIQTFIPFNVSKNSYTNNILPVCININNSLDNDNLLYYLHNIFDFFKYSLFIPITVWFSPLATYIPIKLRSNMYNLASSQQDYMFTNLISPSLDLINSNLDINVKNIRFLNSSQYNTISFNSISVDNNINIICSFKEGVITNKKRFKKCVYKAYKSLLDTSR